MGLSMVLVVLIAQHWPANVDSDVDTRTVDEPRNGDLNNLSGTAGEEDAAILVLWIPEEKDARTTDSSTTARSCESHSDRTALLVPASQDSANAP